MDVDQTPAVFGNYYVVWRSNQDGDNEIYLYNLISQAEINISNDNAYRRRQPCHLRRLGVWGKHRRFLDVDVFLYSIKAPINRTFPTARAMRRMRLRRGDKIALGGYQ